MAVQEKKVERAVKREGRGKLMPHGCGGRGERLLIAHGPLATKIKPTPEQSVIFPR